MSKTADVLSKLFMLITDLMGQSFTREQLKVLDKLSVKLQETIANIKNRTNGNK
jgi:hypothetical protein